MRNKFSFFKKRKSEPVLIDYCAIEAYNQTGFVITLPARLFIEVVRSMIKEAKTKLADGWDANHIGVKVVLKEQLEEGEPFGELFDTDENFDTPLFKVTTTETETQIEILYSLKAFNGKILDFANNIIKTINKFDEKDEILNKLVRICVPDINDSFIEFNWSVK